jgi:hypothetical protein
MTTRTLADGNEIPLLGLGVWQVDDGPDCENAVRCALELGAEGWSARPTGPQGSHILTSMLGADGLAVIPAESGSLEAGAVVAVEPFAPLSGPSGARIPAPTPSGRR